MSITHAEALKRQLTGRRVVVHEGIPELRRFVGLTGTVKTVNMSGRALVQFDSRVDISWYDIDPGALKVVPEPVPGSSVETAAAKPPVSVPRGAASVAAGADRSEPAPGDAKESILDRIRRQEAAKRAEHSD